MWRREGVVTRFLGASRDDPTSAETPHSIKLQKGFKGYLIYLNHIAHTMTARVDTSICQHLKGLLHDAPESSKGKPTANSLVEGKRY
jgi:hypothetical protein